MRDPVPQIVRLEDYSPPAFLISTVELDVELFDEHALVRSRLAVTRNPAARDRKAPLVLDGEEVELESVALDGRALTKREYSLDAKHLTIANVPERFTLETVCRTHPKQNTRLSGLYASRDGYFTQCEAEGFRRITFFPDRPDVMARYTTTLHADSDRYPVLLSNGNLVASGEDSPLVKGGPGGISTDAKSPDSLRESPPLSRGSVRHWAKWEDPFPKPSYLFAMVAAKLDRLDDHFVTRSGRKVALSVFVEPGRLDQCGFAMQALKRAMKWDEDVFGLELDLDRYMIVAVGDFNMGAMENKGLNIFNTKYVLAQPETATDTDYMNIDRVVAHEYFHNWTGNRVTCRDWFQLSLKEGLTVFRDQEYGADTYSRTLTRIQEVRGLRAAQFPEDAGPMAHPVRPNSYMEISNFYTATVYEKGAEVVRMIHTLVGAQGFRRGMDLYFQRHDGQAVTCDEFVQAMADASGVDLAQFKRWYDQAGTPMIEAKSEYDAARKRYVLTLRQSCPPTSGQKEKLPFHIPLCLGLVGPDGKDMPLQLEGESVRAESETVRAEGKTVRAENVSVRAEPVEARTPNTYSDKSPFTLRQAQGERSCISRVLSLKKAEEQFTFVNVPAKPVASLLREFSAPVVLKYAYDEAELTHLMAHDSDAVNRWEAGQRLATTILLEGTAAIAAGNPAAAEKKFAIPPAYIEACKRILADGMRDPAFAAEALSLPGESYLAEQMAIADPDAIHAARIALRRQIAQSLRAELLAAYITLVVPGPYRADAQSAGKRALRNLCLGYLMEIDDAAMRALANAQLRGADNMTDAIAALATLANCDCAERTPALEAFYAKWKHEPLVVDKWLAIQAGSRLAGTLAEVQRLARHEAFDARNPNKVYALIGGFRANQVRFHAADGSGYAFLAAQVIALDATNPQVASRMARGFDRWRKFDAGRQAHARAALERIRGVQGLSKDVLEIVTRALG